ncbi:MAG: hypothetical protein KatS3mg059_1090 [Thermomicrobiales bacterium]|nr:MAG: hypothetical protein KatS3mg059_1090 [Thermomicrobiales bacterium]
MAKGRVKFKKERPPEPTEVGAPWRLFLAVPMPEPAIELVGEIIEALAEEEWPVRWVAAKTAHLTLHFLGDTEPERAELLRLALGATVARHSRFTLHTGELGVFPSEQQPRVIWLGLRGETRGLTRLHADLGARLTELEFPVEQRPLAPHVTLGRLREPPTPEVAAAIRRRLSSPALRERVARGAVSIPVHEVVLVRSFLERSGARHEPVARYPLREASEA